MAPDRPVEPRPRPHQQHRDNVRSDRPLWSRSRAPRLHGVLPVPRRNNCGSIPPVLLANCTAAPVPNPPVDSGARLLRDAYNPACGPPARCPSAPGETLHRREVFHRAGLAPSSEVEPAATIARAAPRAAIFAGHGVRSEFRQHAHSPLTSRSKQRSIHRFMADRDTHHSRSAAPLLRLSERVSGSGSRGGRWREQCRRSGRTDRRRPSGNSRTGLQSRTTGTVLERLHPTGKTAPHALSRAVGEMARSGRSHAPVAGLLRL